MQHSRPDPFRCSASLRPALAQCRVAGVAIATLQADAPQSLFDYRPDRHTVYVLGNETSGVSAEVAALADAGLAIPMARGVESLNVAVTAALIAYAETAAGGQQ